LKDNGKTVFVVQSNDLKKDINDVLRTYGSDAVKELFLNTVFEGITVKDLGNKEGVNLGMAFEVNKPIP
jgi:hypothetical protein